MICGVRIACRGAVKCKDSPLILAPSRNSYSDGNIVAHIFIASLHFCLYLILVFWPICIPFILISRVPGLGFSKMLLFLASTLISFVVMMGQSIVFVSIVSATAHESKLTAS